MDHLYFRTEASAAIGLGHVMRCCAIAEEAGLQGISTTFLLNDVHPAIAERLTSIGAKIERLTTHIGQLEDALAIIGKLDHRSALILDSYAIDNTYIAALHDHLCLVLMDDLAKLSPMPCCFVINASAAAFDLPYELCAPEAKKLLGPDYAQIRHEFTQASALVAHEPSVAIMFGGSDPKAYSLATSQRLLEELPDVTIKVIAGPALQGLEDLRALSKRYSRLKIFSNPPRVADVLAGSSLVITAAGGSVGEIAAMGLMALVVVVANNQQLSFSSCPYPVFDGQNNLPEDLALSAARYLNDPVISAIIAENAKKLVDGKGCARIVKAIKACV